MPSGGQIPVSVEEADNFAKLISEVVKWGLQEEWARYFLGGLHDEGIDLKLIHKHAGLAAIEWDI